MYLAGIKEASIQISNIKQQIGHITVDSPSPFAANCHIDKRIKPYFMLKVGTHALYSEENIFTAFFLRHDKMSWAPLTEM